MKLVLSIKILFTAVFIANDFTFKMPIDVFGRARGSNLSSSPSTSAFKSMLLKQQQLNFTKDGSLDLENHRICNVSLPSEKNDVCTKYYADVIVENFNKKSDNLIDALKVLNKNIADADRLWDNKFNSVKSNVENQMALKQKQIDKLANTLSTVSNFNFDVEILNKKVQLLIANLDNEINNLKTTLMGNLADLTAKMNMHLNSEINKRIKNTDDKWKEFLSSNGKDVDLLRERIAKLEQLHPDRKRLKSNEETSTLK